MYSLGTHSHENNICKYTECLFNSIQREYSAIGDCLDSLNMLRMRSVCIFLIIYGYIFESHHLGKPSFEKENLFINNGLVVSSIGMR